MQLPLAHFDASVIEEVPTDLWRLVFDAVGWPATLESKRPSFSHADVLDAFERDNPTDDLLQALEVLHSLGTESGREAIIAAMRDRRVPMERLPVGGGEREFALHLFLAQRADASLADVFARAQTQVDEGGDHRRYNEFLGKEAHVVSGVNEKRDALRDATLAYCRENDLGDHVQVRAFEDDGAYVFHVIRSHHTRKPLAIVPGRSARATIEYRPVHGDILRYDSAVGRLRIAARAASIVEFYQRAVGRVLFGDEMFFVGDPLCSLSVLQERGREALESHSVPGVGRVRMTECLWERGDRDVLHIRSSDSFRTIEELGLPLSEGELVQAKLKLEVIGKSTRPLTVTIRAPSRIEVSQKRHERIADQFLTQIGIRNAARRSSQRDLWSLHPWRHPVAIWRALFRGDTDALIERGALVPIQLSAVSRSAEAGPGHLLDAHAISAGEFYGVSRAPEIASRSLSSTDVDGFQLNPEQFRVYLRERLAMSDTGVPWNGEEELYLGTILVGDVHIHLDYAIQEPSPGVGARLRARAGGNHCVLLVPTARADKSELARAIIDPLPTRAEVTRKAIAASGLTSAVPAVFSAPEGTRLVVDSARGKVWIDGVEIEGLRAGTHPFRLVDALAKRSPSAVSTEELTNELSGARKDGDTTARQAKAAAKKHISEAMAKAGRTLDEDPFPIAKTGYYRCALLSYVV